jgi:methyl-accepting chemotaxis protein
MAAATAAANGAQAAARKRVSRRTYFIRQSSQPHLIVSIQGIYLLLLIFSGVLFYWVANQDLSGTYLSAHLKVENTMQILLPSLIALNVTGLILATLASVFFTHRITGPVYRLTRLLREAGQGNLANLAYFRQNDELKELAGAYDAMIVDLNARVTGLQAHADSLAGAIGRMPPDSDVRRLAEESSALSAGLASFRLLSRDRADGHTVKKEGGVG